MIQCTTYIIEPSNKICSTYHWIKVKGKVFFCFFATKFPYGTEKKVKKKHPKNKYYIIIKYNITNNTSTSIDLLLKIYNS